MAIAVFMCMFISVSKSWTLWRVSHIRGPMDEIQITDMIEEVGEDEDEDSDLQ